MSSGAGGAFHRFPTDLRHGIGTKVRESGGAYTVDFDPSNLAQSPVAPDGALVPVYTIGADAPVLAPIGSGSSSAKAGAPVGSHKILYALSDGTVATSSSDSTSQAGKIIGMSIGSAAQGSSVQYVYLGPVDDPSWAWQSGPVYLGPSGDPTQTYPTSGFIQQIGIAASSTRINIRLEAFVILA